MDAREFSEWIAYAGIEPFGDDWRPACTVAALLANHYSGGKGRHYTSDNFMPLSQPETTEPTFTEIYASLKAMSDGDRNQS